MRYLPESFDYGYELRKEKVMKENETNKDAIKLLEQYIKIAEKYSPEEVSTDLEEIGKLKDHITVRIKFFKEIDLTEIERYNEISRKLFREMSEEE